MEPSEKITLATTMHPTSVKGIHTSQAQFGNTVRVAIDTIPHPARTHEMPSAMMLTYVVVRSGPGYLRSNATPAMPRGRWRHCHAKYPDTDAIAIRMIVRVG